MLHYHSLSEAQELFKVLSAPMRIKIMELLYEGGDRNLNDLATALGLTNSAVSLHIKALESAGLIEVHSAPGKRGSMKICKPLHESLLINMAPVNEIVDYHYEDEIAIGYYSNCEIHPTCGIATPKDIIGEFDDPRYFQFADRFNAGIFWFGYGYVEYTLPNHLTKDQKAEQITLSFEISSEFPCINENFPSDIEFYFNNTYIGTWISPGDFGLRPGLITPSWWIPSCNQYGLLKTLSINHYGTYIDSGEKISSVTIDDFNLTCDDILTFRFQVSKNAKNCGGFTLFGREFGDYDQGIIFKTFYGKR